MFDVVKVPLVAETAPEKGGQFEAPESFGVFRTDTNAWLGTVGKQYTPVQCEQVHKLLRETCDIVNIDCSNIQFREYRGGSKVSFKIPLPQWTINAFDKDVDDVTLPYLLFIHSFDGSTSFTPQMWTWRQICSNGMMGNGLFDFLKNSDFELRKFRHTKSVKMKVDQVGQYLNSTLQYHRELEKLLNDWAQIPFGGKDVDPFITSILGYTLDEANKEESARKINKFERMVEATNHELTSAGGNLFGALNGVTQFTNHTVERDDQEEYLLFRQGATLNDKAVKVVGKLAEQYQSDGEFSFSKN